MKKISICIIVCVCFVTAHAQSIAGYEYWFNANFDNRFSVSTESGDITLNLDVSSLQQGVHFFNFRAKDNLGLWSTPIAHYFYRSGTDRSNNKPVVYEYWIDGRFDKRVRQGWNGSDVLTLDLNLSQLTEGVHFISLRVQDEMGLWSTPVSSYFFRSGADRSQNKVTGYEYWIDADFLNRKEIETKGEEVITLDLNLAPLKPGIHYLNFRAKDESDSWSSPAAYYFYRADKDRSTNRLANYEYWVDNNFANRKKLTADSNGVIDLGEIDVSSLLRGVHYFNFRAQDSFGTWSSPVSYYFYRSDSPKDDNKIVAYEYWCNEEYDGKVVVNTDPVNPFELKDIFFDISNVQPVVTPDTFQLVPDKYGEAKIYYAAGNNFNIRFQDMYGNWSRVSSSPFGDGIGNDVQADTLFSNKQVIRKAPAANEIHFYKLNALKGDSLIWNTDRPCIVQVFDPYGVEVLKITKEDSTNKQGVRAKRDGVYYVLLHSAVNTNNDIKLEYRHIHKYAVLGYDVKKVGNEGISTINFVGNGFDTSTKVILTNNNNEIVPSTIICEKLETLSTVIDFTEKEKSFYDINIAFQDTVIVIKNGIEVEESNPIELDVSVIGPPDFRIGSPITYTITVKNNGNATAYQVPLNIKIISNAENSIENLQLSDNIPKPQLPDGIDLTTFSGEDRSAIHKYYNEFQDIYHFFYLHNEEEKEYIYTNDFFLENIPPNSFTTITISLISLTSVDIEAIVPKNWSIYYDHPQNKMTRSNTLCCLYSTVDCVLSLGEIFSDFPLSGCVYSAIRSGIGFGFSVGCEDSDYLGEKIASGTISLHNSIVSGILGCMEDEIKKLNVFWRFMNKLQQAINTTVTCKEMVDSWVSGDCLGTPNKDKQHSDGAQSYDPNDKIGYRSPTGSTYFKEDIINMTYIINFENDPEKATAAAQDVYITDTLDLSKYDIDSFRAEYVMVGSRMSSVLYEAQEYTWEIDMRPEMNLITRVNLTLDKEKGIARWHFASIDPATDEPTTDVFAGFLPPNDEFGNGQGCVSFTIDLKKDLPDGTKVSNIASIVFDYNDPIITPEWTNKKDIFSPNSKMSQPIELNDSIINLQWKGEDKGSGIWKYSVYARAGDQGMWYPLWNNTEAEEGKFRFYPDIKYSFYVTSIDKAYNFENKEPQSEVTFYKSSVGINENDHGRDYIIGKDGGIIIVNADGFSCQIYEPSGRVIYTNKKLKNPEDVRLDKGIYIIKIWNSKRVLVNTKLIIK